jgi:hypothetical protein
MRLNLGCGYNKRPGWTNVDHSPACQPDQVVELESFPWPWADSSVDEILMNHVLEHLGATPQAYIGVMKEIWRVCRGGASVTIVVPHPRHDDFLADPTHVRPITAPGLALFSRKLNEEWVRAGAANTPLALYHGVDFEIVKAEMRLDEPWSSRLTKGEIDQASVAQDALRYNNVIKEQEFVLRVVKP